MNQYTICMCVCIDAWRKTKISIHISNTNIPESDWMSSFSAFFSNQPSVATYGKEIANTVKTLPNSIYTTNRQTIFLSTCDLLQYIPVLFGLLEHIILYTFYVHTDKDSVDMCCVHSLCLAVILFVYAVDRNATVEYDKQNT